MILIDLQELLPEYKIKKVSEEDYESLFNLESSNIDFYLCTQGRAVTYEEAINDTIELPPNTTQDQKFYIVFYDEDRLVAVMDYIENYPGKGIVWIGFFMVDANIKRKKLGTKIISAFENTLRKNNIQKMQLGCIDSNSVGMHFWKSLDMQEIRRVISKDDNRPDWNIIVFEKNLL